MEEKSIVSPSITESLWRFLASLKLTVVLLLCLAVLSIIGTLIPQGLSPQDYAQRYGLFGYRLIVLFDIADMYRSWWFVGLLLLLVINIVVCSIDRFQSVYKIVFVNRPVFDLKRYRSRPNRQEFTADVAHERLKSPFQSALAKQYRYCEIVETEQGFAVTAEKGRWTRLGVYVVHLSIVVLLFGGLIGSKFGFEGFVAIPEGETADTIRLSSNGQMLKLPFTIRCDSFNLSFYEGTRRPKEYRSSLTIIEEGREVRQKDIVVNDPLSYNGIGIYQSSYGPLDERSAPVARNVDPAEPVEISFRSAGSGMVYTRKATIGQALQLPEGLGEFVLEQYVPAAEFRGMDLGPAFIAKLAPPEGESTQITLPLQYPKFDSMRGGSVAVSIATASGNPGQQRYYTGLVVSHDPGVWVVYAGFILLIAGCYVAFFMSHQQVVVEVNGKGKGNSVVMVSGKSNKFKVGLEMKLQRLTDRLKKLAESGAPR
jgi:cytochrome c biogenesis protein